MKNLSVLIKPASSACNMKCNYCFYNLKTFNGIIKNTDMELIIKSAFETAEKSVLFAFQGGEPTLAGISFYKNTIDTVKKFNTKNIKVNYSIQTNGFIINNDWADFFYKNNFLVGVSLDGPSEIHNHERKDFNDMGTFNIIMKSILILKKHKVDFNILSVVTGNSSRFINKTYNFFKTNNLGNLQFIPCMEPLNNIRVTETYYLSSKRYAKFLIDIFDSWYNDLKNGKYISIRHIDNWLSILLKNGSESCNMNGICSIQFVIESNLSVYPCDFYVLDDKKIGTIGELTLEEMVNTKTAKDFLEESLYIPHKCKNCEYYFLCRNGCKRDRIIYNDKIENNFVNFYCDSYKEFFSKRKTQLVEAAKLLYSWNFNNN